ncbi:hypothetical protein CHGG_08782 [Chaetomium globosum CBS 148.51]|uniref:Siderophore biosynthesis enzyme n=1 Tax=Chaetomium globosum (strain ATCC 6205 / CBS 148.51 / DSM 1962 / NBRC 6347 / NRRL 1970) TaxID=306901 RepID=Q2GTC2_CHAGB|nr:uncharacterized protein CHGG_08782 [Chaetomium globosum CBS 148.51]EAQ84768.1 hypothetical protein CHGG_08782 [Chaetomium globosum CBS 148.51]
MAGPTTRLTTALPLILALLAAAGHPVAARTDYAGCVSTELPAAHTTIWYVPGTGELCEPVDCGGGRAPPKTVPGCPAYKGTETVTPKFWDGFEGAAKATPTAGPGAGGDGDGEDSADEGEDGDGEGEDGGNGVGVGVGVTGGAKGTVTVTLGGGTAAVSRTASRTKDVEETGAAGAGGDSDDEDEDGEGGKSSAATATGGGRKPMATLTQVMTAVETVDGVARPAPTSEGDGEGVAAQSTVSLAAAMPTAAVVGKTVFGVVAAGVAAAGLVLA